MNTSLKYLIPFIAVVCLAYYCNSGDSTLVAKDNMENNAESEKLETTKFTSESKNNAIASASQSDVVKETSPVESKPVTNTPKIKETPTATKPKPITKPKPKPKPIVKRPKISFEEATYDFGEITEGDIIKHKFKFKNTGNAELVIESAKASCGCTDPSYPFLGIAPGEEGYIGVTYNSVSKDGPQKPDIIIKTNAAKESMALYMVGLVNAKEKEEKKDTLTINN